MAEVIKMPGTVRSVNGIEPDENANVQLPTKVEPENIRYATFLGRGAMQSTDMSTVGGNRYYDTAYEINVDISSFAKEIIKQKCTIAYLLYASSNSSTSVKCDTWGEADSAFDRCISAVKTVDSSSTFSGRSSITFRRLWNHDPITAARFYEVLITLAYVPVDETSGS